MRKIRSPRKICSINSFVLKTSNRNRKVNLDLALFRLSISLGWPFFLLKKNYSFSKLKIILIISSIVFLPFKRLQIFSKSILWIKLKTTAELTNNGMADVDQSSVCAVRSLKFVALHIECKTILCFSSKLIPEKSTVLLDSVVFEAIFSKKSSNSML